MAVVSWLLRRRAQKRPSVMRDVRVGPPASRYWPVFLVVTAFLGGAGAGYFVCSVHRDVFLARSFDKIFRAKKSIERLAADQMTWHIQRLENDNAQLREQLAVYAMLGAVHAQRHSLVEIEHFSAKKRADGSYDYHLLLVNRPVVSDGRPLTVTVRFEATSLRSDHHLWPVPLLFTPNPPAPIVLAYFRKIDGQFVVIEPQGHVLKSLTAFVYVGRHLITEKTHSFY